MFIVCCSVREFMDFTSKIIVERTDVAQRASVKEQGTYEMLSLRSEYEAFSSSRQIKS